jgi:hypothetical protein
LKIKQYLLALAASVWLIPLAAYAQVTLTGAIGFATNYSGAYTPDYEWNTLGGDPIADLWLAQNPDATLPINGPSDAEAGISIPLLVGNSYKYYIFTSGPCCAFNLAGLNLFFDGNGSPGISVFGAVNSSAFLPNGSGTLTLEGASVPGAGTAAYSSNGVIVVLSGYEMNTPTTPPGDVCQYFAFTPGNALTFFGSITLQVWSAASLNLSQANGSPGTQITLTGIGFAANETVEIFAGHIGLPPLFTATTTDASGAFAVEAREPQHPYGLMDVYAVGATSHKLGAATLSVTPGLAMTPATGTPGGSTIAHGLGFGSGETIDIYWNNPRQLLGTAPANSEGTGSLTITIPPNAPSGINSLIGVGQTTKATGVGVVEVQ